MKNQAALRYVQISRAFFTSHSVKFGRPFFAFLRFFLFVDPPLGISTASRQLGEVRHVQPSRQLSEVRHHYRFLSA